MGGLLYAFTKTGGIHTFDLACIFIIKHTLLRLRWVMCCKFTGNKNTHLWKDNEIILETEDILLYKVDMAGKELVETNGFDDLFIGQNQSLCLNAEE